MNVHSARQRIHAALMQFVVVVDEVHQARAKIGVFRRLARRVTRPAL
jgi:hypothetical protein